MREIFFEEKLGETRRNSEGCEPHGQRWGASGGVRAARARMGEVGGMGDFWGRNLEVLEGGNGGISENN